MTKKRLRIRDRKIKRLLTTGGRKGAKQAFFDLLKQAVDERTTS